MNGIDVKCGRVPLTFFAHNSRTSLLLSTMIFADTSHLNLVNPGFNVDGTLPFATVLAMFKNKWETTKYLCTQGVLQYPDACPNCGSGVGYKKDPYTAEVLYQKGVSKKGASDYKTCFTYRCKNRKCSAQQSVFHGSFFENSKKPLEQVLMCLHLWLLGTHQKTSQDILKWSEGAVLQYYHKFRLMVSQEMSNFIKQDIDIDMFTYFAGMIGGPGIEVQIDESAFGKRKYNRGHRVETKWVFGGVEIVPDENMVKRGGPFFAVVVEDRTIKTLDEVIKKFIKPGSIIVSDSFSSYKNLEERMPQYEHLMVNHSKHYVDPVSKACTNTVEGKWNKLKKSIPRQGFRTDEVLQEYLGEQMWRKCNGENLWEAAMIALKNWVKMEL